jgi:RNA polymerase sigma-70 factor (ECF subfamily)
MDPLRLEHDPETPVIQAIQAGDSHALAELMSRHGAWVRGVIFGALGRPDEVEDVAQRVWMTVWREAHRLSDPGRWRVWLYRIARNAATDAGRRRQRRRKLLSTLWRRAESQPSVGLSAEAPVESHERREMMLQAIGNLPELYREPFVLRHLDGWSYAQIAEAMGLPVDTVETRLVRARRLLRHELAGKV